MNEYQQIRVNSLLPKASFETITLKHSSVVPLYIQIKKALKEDILRGCYRKNEALPAMRVVAQRNSVSTATVEKAYRELQRDGLVSRVKGMAYFVRGIVNS